MSDGRFSPSDPPSIYPNLEGNNMSDVRPPKPSDLRRPCINGPFYPIPYGRKSGITRSRVEARWAIQDVVCGSPLVECATWGTAFLLYTRAYLQGQAMVCNDVPVHRHNDNDVTLKRECDDDDGPSNKRVKQEIDTAEDELDGDDDDMECDDDADEPDNDADLVSNDPGSLEGPVFGPPSPHPQFIVVTENSLGCICGCGRTVKAIQKEKRAKRKQRRAAREALIWENATAAAHAEAANAVRSPLTLTIHLDLAALNHLPANVSHLTIAPVINIPFPSPPTAVPIVAATIVAPVDPTAAEDSADESSADESSAEDPTIENRTRIDVPVGERSWGTVSWYPDNPNNVPLWGTVSGWPEDDDLDPADDDLDPEDDELDL